jgi:hypothetical protein
VLVAEGQISGAFGARSLLAGEARRDADVAAYRAAVSGILAELTETRRYVTVESTGRLLTRRLREPAFASVLAAVPHGPEAAVRSVLREIRSYRHGARNSAASLLTMVRIALLAQIDVLWWGHLPEYQTDADVFGASELLQLEPLRRDDMLLFRYRMQPTTLLGRAARSAERRAVPERAPRTAGLRFPCGRAELVVVLNQIAAEFTAAAPPGTPRMWVTSLTRSVSHQRRLRALGYSALLPSAHCVGYAADLEMAWFRQFGADRILRALLVERQDAGEINVIDEGQAWHVCVRPGSGRALRLIPDQPARS